MGLVALAIIFTASNMEPRTANAAATLDIKFISWHVVGLDSNNVASGPNLFPVAARVCNTGDTPATNVSVQWHWDTTNTYIDLQSGTTNPLTLASLPSGTGFYNSNQAGPVPAHCADFYFNIVVTRNAAAYDQTRQFHITATADGLGTVSTPTPREIYVEKLVSQNRNDVTSITGPTLVVVGETYTYNVIGSTATQGYEQLVFSLDFPNVLFRVRSVNADYSKPTALGTPDNNSMYADACGWDSVIGLTPPKGTYRSCIGPVNFSGGKAGGDVNTTYTVLIMSAGGPATLTPLIYDFSGSSYHYNTDYGLDTLAVTAINPLLSKTVYFGHNSGASCPGTETVFGPTGGNITYCFAITNTSSHYIDHPALPAQLLTDATLGITDDNMTLLSGTFPLAPGATATYYYETTLTADVVNTATLNANPTDSGGNDVAGVNNITDNDDASVTQAAASATVNKTVYFGHDSGASCTGADSVSAGVGADVTYCFVVENTGDTYLDSLALSDTDIGISLSDMTLLAGADPLPLAPGGTRTYYYEDTASSTLTNTVSLAANPTDSGGNDLVNFSNVTDTDTATVNVFSPALTIDKTLYSGTDSGASCPGAATLKVISSTAITYCFVIKNTGDTYLDSLTITDANLGINLSNMTLASGTFPLAPAASATYYYESTASADLLNTATASANPTNSGGNDIPNLSNPSGSDSATLDVTPTIVADKTASPTIVTEPGGSVTFNFKVENTSPETVSLTSLSDSEFGDMNGKGTCTTPQNINAGATYTCTYTTTISGTGGSVHSNTITATASDDEGNSTSDTDSASVSITSATPDITVTKTASPTSVPEPGGNVTFTVAVQNTTAVDLTLTALSDDVFGDLNGKGTCVTGGTVAAGATYTCSFSGAVSGDAGDTHTNTITATAETSGGSSTSASDDADVTITDVLPTLNVTKTAGSSTIAEPGGTITFTVAVQNTSPEAVTLTVLTDNVYGNLNGRGTCATGGTIAAGATYTCTFTGAVSGDPGDTHTNTVSATIRDNENNTETDSDDATVTITDALPTLTVTKTPSAATIAEPGGTITFTVAVQNTSPEAVTLTTLNDNVYGNLNGQGTCATGGTIAAGATYTCSFTGAVSGDPGDTHTNTVSATITDNENNTETDSDDATVTITDVLPTLNVTKTPSAATVGEPGGTITFTVEVENTSPEVVTLTTLTDNVYGDLNGQGTCATGGTIAIGATYTCTFTGAVSGDPGETHTNTVSATITDDEANTKTNTDNATVTITDVLPTIAVTKTPNPAAVGQPGGNVTFTVEVRNTSPEVLTLNILNDSVYGNLNGQGTCATGGTIAVSATYSCSFTKAISGNSGDTHTNTVTATVTDNETNTATSGDIATVTITDGLPSITVTKTASAATIGEPGGTITFTVEVENTSSEVVTLTSLTDSVYGNLNGQGTCATGGSIAIGATYTCTFPGAVSGNAGDTHTNTVTAQVEDSSNNTASGSDDETVTITDILPTLTVTKTAGSATIGEPGGNITFTVEVENTSVEAVTLTTLNDSVYSDLNGQGTCATGGTIAIGATYTCTFTGAVSGDAGTTHTNTVTATATDDDSNPVTETDDETVTITDVPPTMSVSKTASPGAVLASGGSVDFTFEVTNTSAEDITLTVLDDDIFGDLDGEGTCAVPQTITPAGTYSCTFTRTISGTTGAKHVDTITATANDNESNVINRSDSATVIFGSGTPSIAVTKTPSSATITEPGGNITYTVEVENTDTMPVTLTSLTDDIFGSLNGKGTCATGGTIAVGATYTCTFTEAVSGDAGDTHTNTVTAQVRDASNNTATDSNSASVTITDVLPTIDVTKVASVAQVTAPSGSVTFTFEVENTSPESLTLTTLTDSDFGNLKGKGTCTVPQTISAGATYSCTFTQSITGTAGTTHTNTLTATATDNDGNSVTETDNATVTVASVQVGCVSGLLYNDTNRNGSRDTGEPALPNVRLFLFNPANAPIAEVRTASNGTYTLSSIPVGQYRLEIDTSTLPSGTPLYVNPTGKAQQVQVNIGGTCTSASFGLTLIDPFITKSGSPTVVIPGETIVFTITARNDSTTSITGVTVNDPLSGFLIFTSATTSQGTFTHNSTTNIVTFSLGTLAPGQTATMRVTTRVSGSTPRPTTISNRATIAYNEGVNETSAAATTTVSTAPQPAPSPTPAPSQQPPSSSTDFPTRLPTTGTRSPMLVAAVIALLSAILLAAVTVIWLILRGAELRDNRVLAGIWSGFALALLVAGILMRPGADSSSAMPEQAPNVPILESISSGIEGIIPPPGGQEQAVQPDARESAAGPVFAPPEIPATHIIIPKLDIDTDIVEAPIVGDTWAVEHFTNEIAHLEATAYPGMRGNAVLAGHVMHTKGLGPFRSLHKLEPGDIIIAEGDGISYVYHVTWVDYVDPSDIAVAYPSETPMLTLITCSEWDTAQWAYTQRLVVRAEMVDAVAAVP